MATRQEKLDALRYQGCRGGFISRHRALLFSPADPRKIFTSVLIVVVAVGLWYVGLDWISRFWGGVMDFWAGALGFGSSTGMAQYELGGVRFSVPNLDVSAGLPTALQWWMGILFTVVLVIVSFIMPRRYLPVSFFFRVVAFFQGCSQVFFAFWPYAFPYSSAGYIHTMLIAGLMIVPLTPIVLGFTYHLFDFSAGRKIGLTAMIMIHLAIMIPLQYVAHAWILHHASLLFLPLLFFVTGLPLNVLVFITFFSWGFSWENRLQDPQVQLKVRRRFV